MLPDLSCDSIRVNQIRNEADLILKKAKLTN
jgi:hypothetical protein